MDPEADEQAMAQMMGFSSFGAQDRPQKKRKYNPEADAAVHTTQQAVQPAPTGSNSTPMGTRAPKEATRAANTDEIDLDDGDDDNAGAQGVPIEHGTNPNHVPSGNTSEPATALPHGLPQRPAAGVGFTGLPGGGEDYGRGPRAQHHGSDRAQGQPWYEGYYDTLSNRNPWEKLEKAMGLQPRGTWISHDGQTTGLT